MVTIRQRLKLNQNTMRKTVILLMTLALVVTSIGAAAAKPDKPGEPDKSDELVYYDGTMELVGASVGLSTDNRRATPVVISTPYVPNRTFHSKYAIFFLGIYSTTRLQGLPHRGQALYSRILTHKRTQDPPIPVCPIQNVRIIYPLQPRHFTQNDRNP